MNAQVKFDTIDPQSTHSSTEIIPESEIDTCFLNVSNT